MATEGESVVLQVRVPEFVSEFLDELGEQLDVSRSKLIRELLYEGIWNKCSTLKNDVDYLNEYGDERLDYMIKWTEFNEMFPQ